MPDNSPSQARGPALRAAGVLSLLISLEGIGALLWLLLTPSELENRLIGAYSLERWGMIGFTAILVVLFVLMFWTLNRRPRGISALVEHFRVEKRAAGLLVTSTVVFALVVILHGWVFFSGSTKARYPQLFPLLAFITLSSGQVWIFLLVLLRRASARMLKAWFPVYQEEKILPLTTDKRLVLVIVGISLAYLAIQIIAGIRIPQAVKLGDTTSYLEGASLPLNDPAFFSERRPWGILLLYKLLGGSLAAIGKTQLAVSTLAWLFLAWMLVRSLKSNVGKLVGFLIVLGISLSPTVQAWNHAGLSESFSISMLIFVLALFMGLLQRWKWSIFLALIFSLTIWISIHEFNLYLGFLLALTLFLVGLSRKHFRTFLILSFCIAMMLVVNSHLSSLYALPRWALPVAEVITMRILPVPEHLDYFTSQGMPVRPELLALSGRWAHSDNYAILNNPRLRPFSRWLFQDGKAVYTRFLIAHPFYTLTLPLINLDQMLAADFSRLIPGYKPALPVLLNEFFFPTRWFWIFLGITVLLSGFVFWKQRRERSRIYWLGVVFFMFSIPYLYFAWHADALDLPRHASIANIQFHLGFWLLLLFYLDNKLKMFTQRQKQEININR